MQSVLNALRVLEEVAARQPIGVADLARALKIPKSSTQRALVTLQTAGWIRQSGEGSTRWVVTTKALYVGRHAGGELSLRSVAVPAMEELRRHIDETVHLTVPEGSDRVVLIERLETSKPVRIFMQLGMNLPLHASANGKAVLAASPPAVIERYIAEGMPRFTDTTIDDPHMLRAELTATQLRGYAVNSGEWRTDISAVAAAVVGEAGLPVASISVNMPTSRMTDGLSAEYGVLVRGTALQVNEAIRPASRGGGGATA